MGGEEEGGGGDIEATGLSRQKVGKNQQQEKPQTPHKERREDRPGGKGLGGDKNQKISGVTPGRRRRN